MAESLWL